jgi:hypothetical protein
LPEKTHRVHLLWEEMGLKGYISTDSYTPSEERRGEEAFFEGAFTVFTTFTSCVVSSNYGVCCRSSFSSE